MSRVFLAAVALVALPLGSRGGETTVRLNVRPMQAPIPALKYQLLPEVRELNPGNPAQWYIRCFQEQQAFFFGKEAIAERARYQSMPLAELPVDKLRDYGRSALGQADWAARLDALDWQVLQRVQTEGTDLLLPELRPMRSLAAALQVRFRARVAGRHFDDAVDNAKTMFALARHLGEHPTEAANRIGLSVADQALDTLEEMLRQTNCPNLYWALTDLPCPLVDLRKGLQGDRALVATDLALLRDDVVMTQAEMEEVVSRLSGAIGFARQQAGQTPRSLRAALKARVKDSDPVIAARVRLVSAGCAVGLGFLFPPEQVILLDEKREYEIRRDEEMKLLGLAPWQIDALPRRADRSRDGIGLLADLLPHLIEVRQAQARVEQRVALLRHVEALRLYAAEHDGRLPGTLTAIDVPLSVDPFTGKPFAYQLEGVTGHLRGGALRGEAKDTGFNVHYEVTIRK